ncbi:TPA: DUF2971 domain-containing protein [Raoultella terrigena]|uniref:DUF2971 domain-containing protein n=1 Tax=Raoultella planticola TaxID=575 RepID=UPI000C1B505B|nr:DUF2971 domain-containing protein [Raoultella planticola]PIM85954.1 hypothetical protein CT151_00970 [Raoultella planticola]
MLYYRYRPINALSIKELIYDELYFSYPSELNDPLDGLISYEFPEDFPKWNRLLELAFKGLPIDTISLAERLAAKSPLSVKKLVENPTFLFELILSFVGESKRKLASLLSETLKDFISGYIPPEGCSVSFSRTYENALMWSHYTGKHEGFCLIFRSIEENINQCKSRKNNLINLGDNCALSINDKFKMHDVTYGNKKNIDGFTLFPSYVYGRELSNEELTSYWKNRENIYLTKSACWDYEKESRLYISSSLACVSKEALSSIDRIFHYDNSQIAGVIYGMRMSEKNKRIIKEILLRKSKERYMDTKNEKYLFDIVSFDARFNDDQHTISIEPSEIFDCGKVINNSNPSFNNKYTSWKNGEALHIYPTDKGMSSLKVVLD